MTHKHKWIDSANETCPRGCVLQVCEGSCHAYRCETHDIKYDLINGKEKNIRVRGRRYKYL
jgi:hypothetical protein